MLPAPGGLFEQPFGYVWRLEQVMAADSAKLKKDQNKAEAKRRLEDKLGSGI